MNLAEKLQPSLSSWKADERANWTEALADENWTVNLTADRNDTIGSLVWELELTRTGPAPDALTVRRWAETISARASGLLEHLKMIEADTVQDKALLRSDAPSRKGDLLAYYELLLTGTHSARVRRYQANRATGTPREQVAFAVTHEVLAKLIDDITR